MMMIPWLLLLGIESAFVPKRINRTGLVANGANFTLDGNPIRLLSGSIHYFRIPAAYWRDRLQKLKLMGFNTVQTYVAWNYHEETEGTFNFDLSTDRDLETFLEIADEEGLYVILRPGPYICAEWEWGGFPAWLLTKDNMIVRSTKSKSYTTAVANWFKVLLAKVNRFQYTKGGNIIAVQIENEYGSYPSQDHDYLPWVRDQLTQNGIVELMFTSDGGSQLNPVNLLDGVLHTVNFQEVGTNLEQLKKVQPDKPMMVTEFWAGWFDHWGEKHHTTTVKDYESNLRKILDSGASVNLYMFTGGTSFGFMAGSNWNGQRNISTNDVTSYDYDAPLNEFGDWTVKYNVTRKVISDYFPNTPLPDLNTFVRPITKNYGPVSMKPLMTIWDALQFETDFPLIENQAQPLFYENFPNASFQSTGYAMYTTHVSSALNPLLSNLRAALSPNMTRATMYYNQGRFGTIDLQSPIPDAFNVPTAAPLFRQLDILTESAGRVNFHKLDGNHMGLGVAPDYNGKPLTGFDIQPLPMGTAFIKRIGNVTSLQLTNDDNVVYPCFFKGTIKVDSIGDTFVDVLSSKSNN